MALALAVGVLALGATKKRTQHNTTQHGRAATTNNRNNANQQTWPSCWKYDGRLAVLAVLLFFNPTVTMDVISSHHCDVVVPEPAP